MKSEMKAPAQVRAGDRVMLGLSTIATVVGRGRVKATVSFVGSRGRKRSKQTNCALLFYQLDSGQLFQQTCQPRDRVRVVKGGVS